MRSRKSVISTVTAVLVLFGLASPLLAETSKVSAIIPWQGQGQLFPVAANKLRFLGAFEGIMYVETAEGAMNEAFVRCPIVQDVDGDNLNTLATGSCVITVSSEDVVFAELTCKGVAGLCKGDFKLTSGTGRFAGISGAGKMTVRSPIHALAADLSEGTMIHAAAGLLQIPDLEVRLP